MYRKDVGEMVYFTVSKTPFLHLVSCVHKVSQMKIEIEIFIKAVSSLLFHIFIFFPKSGTFSSPIKNSIL